MVINKQPKQLKKEETMQVFNTIRALTLSTLPKSLVEKVAKTYLWVVSLDDSLSYMFGGELYVCETEDDIKQIETVKWSDELNRYLNPHEVVCTWDSADYIDDWARLFLSTNNAGGPVYLIPPGLFTYARIEEIMALQANEEAGILNHETDQNGK
jgi:hypothetical protein